MPVRPLAAGVPSPDPGGDDRAAVGRVVIGVLVALALGLAGTAATGRYTVKPGETLSGVAARTGGSVHDLAAANGIRDPNRIVAGQTLVVPGAGTSAATTAGSHVVRPGETLSDIAARYGLSVRSLAAANGITNVNRVIAGARLRVDGAAASASTAAVAPAAARSHVVASGETLGSIASRYGVGIQALAAANGISNPNRVGAGTRLAVPAAGTGQARTSWACPVAGPTRYVNDYGVAKPDGRTHEGIDVFAARGTTVVAPVSGRVEQVSGSRGGLQFWLYGNDGTLYIGTHMDSAGRSGRVGAGEPVGTVGTTGNARGTSPHLHFEIHPGGTGASSSVNPNATLRGSCG